MHPICTCAFQWAGITGCYSMQVREVASGEKRAYQLICWGPWWNHTQAGQTMMLTTSRAAGGKEIEIVWICCLAQVSWIWRLPRRQGLDRLSGSVASLSRASELWYSVIVWDSSAIQKLESDKVTHCISKLWMCYKLLCIMTFPYSELLQYLFYSSLWLDRSWLIPYDILTALSVSLTADFPLINYFSHDYSSWLITYNILSQIDLVCAPDLLVYKPSIQTIFFSFDLD